jgi:hypothetical protein
MDMDIRHAAWTLGMDLQHGHKKWTYIMDLDIRRHAAWTWACNKDMGMQHGYGHAAWNGLTGLDNALDFLLM